MEQLPEVALFCHEEGPYLDFVVPQHILPHIVKLITDRFSQVRKAAQIGLLTLLEKEIIQPRQVSDQVCPVIMNYTEASAMDDYRTEVTGFMSKLARYVGKEIVVNWFLERFCALCQDPMFQVRRVCASSMGEMAAVIGTRLTEAVLLPEFISLCKDDVWGVRKGCAEIFTDIARLCQLSTRRDLLTPVFLKLLEDTTRWVKVAAYQSLGSFITTFAVDDTPVCIPELTEFEKTFIEKLQENPSLLGTEKSHRNAMLNSESTEDLTAICIHEDSWMDEDEVKFGDDNEKGMGEFDGDGSRVVDGYQKAETIRRKLKLEGDNGPAITKEYSFDYTWTGEEPETQQQQQQEENTENSSSPSIELNEPAKCDEASEGIGSRKRKKELEEDKKHNISVSPVVTVHAPPSQSGVHIRVEKETPHEITKICRSSAVLSHRPSFISGGVHTTNISSSNNDSTSSAGSGTDNTTTKYNTFQYWRIPLPDIELDIGMVEGKPASVHVRAKVEDPKLKLTYASEISVNLSSETLSVTKTATATSAESKQVTENNDPGATCEATLIEGPKVENLQIQTLSSSSISDNESDLNTKLESSLNNTTVTLVDGHVSEVHRSYMDLYNVGKDNGGGNGSGVEDITLDMTRLDAYDDDSDDQLSSCTYPFRDEPKKTRLLPELPKSSIVLKQDVVPDILLDHFIGMSQDADPELAPCCVFNLPAVVLTLGPQHWSILRDCYENLAGSLQWKVRYTLAACLHEIANILGPELSERDLIPFYTALMKDLDEVRIGVLKHLAFFFKILGGEERKKCLKSIKCFIKTDNPRNWRFRLELVYQIQQLVDMFEMDDVFKHVCPVCIDLIKDNVAEIRRESLHASLSESSKWVRRQTFAALSGQLIATNALYPSQFAQDILPHLIGLSEDKVPNVRLVVARSIVSCVLQQDSFNDPLNPFGIRVMETLTKLQEDVDQDVRFHSQNNLLAEK
ncbi:Serine/threonine-protein phosphatase 4 regulatory subunit 1 [Orchesella cincta]|uniref:Serine/threonine-protein phosphatase 4 regulatory subunit 1 n=1 Tax=Orchesella cincta TaxID=48709 RepID=A0A1D2MV46_ORCCI|nr:Serine/threonine-protein phosphatase 4 regulatory subunit 1 [Orchesella cincta]